MTIELPTLQLFYQLLYMYEQTRIKIIGTKWSEKIKHRYNKKHRIRHLMLSFIYLCGYDSKYKYTVQYQETNNK